jgi:hypothetical protein
MNEYERELIEELKKHLRGELQRKCVDAFLKEPGSEAIVKTVLEGLEKAINEANKP